MDWITRSKHWQVFLVLMLGSLLINGTIEDNEALTTFLSVSGGIVYFAWPILIGHELYQKLPKRIELNYYLFLFNGILWLIIYVTVTIISDGEGMTFNGTPALLGFYMLYALIYCHMFPARVLKSIESGRKVDIGECFGTFLLMLVLPIGIWFLQPRINKIAELKNRMIVE